MFTFACFVNNNNNYKRFLYLKEYLNISFLHYDKKYKIVSKQFVKKRDVTLFKKG